MSDRDQLAHEFASVIHEYGSRGYGAENPPLHLALADLAIALMGPAAHLDPARAADTLDWCKREGGLDLYGWGDLISRLNDCVVPTPPDAQSKVAAAYRKGFDDGLASVQRH